MIGVFRFKYVLNRMHAAAMGDTLGIGFALAGLILMSGFTFTSVKLLLVIVFLVVCISGILTSDRASGSDDERG